MTSTMKTILFLTATVFVFSNAPASAKKTPDEKKARKCQNASAKCERKGNSIFKDTQGVIRECTKKYEFCMNK